MDKINAGTIGGEMVQHLLKELSQQLSDEDTCVCCGVYVPEGRQVCWSCERGDSNG